MKFLTLCVVAFLAAAGCSKQTEDTLSTKERAAGVYWEDVSVEGISDGVYPVYFNVKRVARPDFRIVQDGGSGTISHQRFASWTPGAAGATATYDDVGPDFFGSATFTGAITKLLDDGAKLRTATWVKIVFTVAGASADASYSIEQAFELAKDS